MRVIYESGPPQLKVGDTSFTPRLHPYEVSDELGEYLLRLTVAKFIQVQVPEPTKKSAKED